MFNFKKNDIPATAFSGLSKTERALRLFSDVRPGEGATALLLLLNIFLVLAAYYLIKPVREGWLSISVIKGLSKLEVKAYSSFGQSLVLIGVIPVYSFLASCLSRRALLTSVTLFFSVNLVIFWLLQPGFLFEFVPYAGVAFYLWVGIFSVTVVAQFWSFATDLYTDEIGKRLFPLIAVGASAGAAFGAWFAGRFVKTEVRETFDLILVAVVPLLAALVLSWLADYRGVSGKGVNRFSEKKKEPEVPGRKGAFGLVFGHRYLFMIACLVLLMSWVGTNGENILYGTVQNAIEADCLDRGLTDTAVIDKFVKKGTTAFYGDLYFWVNLSGLIIQALLVSRVLKYGGIPVILMMMPVLALISYSMMAAFPVLIVIRMMKISENAVNYSINNTARHVLWLPIPPSVVYKAKAAVDTLFVRLGDGMAALTVLAGSQLILLPLKKLIQFNVVLAGIWGLMAVFVARENRKLVETAKGEKVKTW